MVTTKECFVFRHEINCAQIGEINNIGVTKAYCCIHYREIDPKVPLCEECKKVPIIVYPKE